MPYLSISEKVGGSGGLGNRSEQVTFSAGWLGRPIKILCFMSSKFCNYVTCQQ